MGTGMNDPNDTDHDRGLLDDLEAEFRGLVEAGDPGALDYAIEHATPLWVTQEFAKRVAATEDMLAEWAEEAAADPPEVLGPRRPAKRAEVVFSAPAAEVA